MIHDSRAVPLCVSASLRDTRFSGIPALHRNRSSAAIPIDQGKFRLMTHAKTQRRKVLRFLYSFVPWRLRVNPFAPGRSRFQPQSRESFQLYQKSLQRLFNITVTMRKHVGDRGGSVCQRNCHK